MGHEVAGDAIVGVIKQNAHDTPENTRLPRRVRRGKISVGPALGCALRLPIAIHNPFNVGGVS